MAAYLRMEAGRMPESPRPPEIDDDALVLRMMDKDETALGEILEIYGPKVKGFLRKQFGDVLKEPELDEAFNCAAFNLWRFADRFKSGRSLRGWFIRIARNAAISIIRGEKKHLSKDLEYDPSYDPADDHSEASPAVDSKEAARLQKLDDFIHNHLTGFEKIVAINCYKAGGEPDTVRLAALYGKTRQNVDTVRSKVKKKLTEWMLNSEPRQQIPKGRP
jgi:RNA polymerase sigma factor (sigma-70 family)